ncbi:MAG: alpha/beta hydrolase [Opitutaceae bacterium]|nr:alpha/beta hydrolase [Opitutaceae bacterium]
MTSPLKLLVCLLLPILALRAEDAITTAAPAGFPDAETHVFREATPEPVRLHVFKPKDWRASDRRPGFVWFYGGGFVRGTTAQSAGWARRAAREGMIGIAPDYRTIARWPGVSATATVADARAALRWAQDNAEVLGLDPERIVVGGSSAGGHLALWTAITKSPMGLPDAEAPRFKPAALLLTCPAADTSKASGMRGERFKAIDPGFDPDSFSPLQNLDAKMPPTLLIHGDADVTVPYAHAVALHRALTETGNVCEFVTVPGGTHKFSTELAEWKTKVPELHKAFLTKHGILPVTVAR